MKKYLDIKDQFSLEYALSKLEEKGRLSEYSVPKEVDDTNRTIVHIDAIGPNGVIFNVEGEYKLIQKFINTIHKARNSGVL